MIVVSNREPTLNSKFSKQSRFKLESKELSYRSDLPPPNAYKLATFTERNKQSKEGFKFGKGKKTVEENQNPGPGTYQHHKHNP